MFVILLWDHSALRGAAIARRRTRQPPSFSIRIGLASDETGRSAVAFATRKQSPPFAWTVQPVLDFMLLTRTSQTHSGPLAPGPRLRGKAITGVLKKALSLTAAVANRVRDELAQEGYLVKSRQNRTIYFRLTDRGLALLLALEQYPANLTVCGRAVNCLVSAVREQSASWAEFTGVPPRNSSSVDNPFRVKRLNHAQDYRIEWDVPSVNDAVSDWLEAAVHSLVGRDQPDPG